ncbi:unnamed protein product [Pylaiella littoralis]
MEGASSGAVVAGGLPVPSAGAGVPLFVGETFSTRAGVRLKAEAELAAAGRAIKNGKSAGRGTCHLVCKTCKSWFVKANLSTKTNDFKVTQLCSDHVNCVGGGGRLGASVVQPMVTKLVQANPKIGGLAIKRTLKTAGYDISDRTSQRVKRRVATASKSQEAAAVARIPSWCKAIERDCPGSVATVEMSGDKRFVRSFMMMGKAAYAAAMSVPKIAAMDAGHLKGSWNGVMYILCMKDSNNHIIHVATVLADKENESNYRFLLEQTCKNEHMKTLLTSGTLTFFTDGHRGSPPALARVLPMAPVRTCVRHLITNSNMKKMGDQDYSAAVYKAAKMPSLELFNECMSPIQELFPANYRLLTSHPLHTWTHHATNHKHVVQDTTTSNAAESTINAVGAETRALNPFHLMTTIAERTVAKLAAHAGLKKDSPQVLVPFADNFMENARMSSLKKYVVDQGLGVYLVQEHGESALGNRVTVVSMPDADGKGGQITCTCHVPSRWHLLCQDALAVLKHLGKLDTTMAFLDNGYTLDSYRKIHSNPDFPVVLPIWSELETSSLLPPRRVRGQAGAPKKGPAPRARIRGRNDNCQRGRVNVGGGGGGGSGSGASGSGASGSGATATTAVVAAAVVPFAPYRGWAMFVVVCQTSGWKVLWALSRRSRGYGAHLQYSVTARKALPRLAGQLGQGRCPVVTIHHQADHTCGVLALATCGDFLVSGSDEGIKVWNTHNWTCHIKVLGHGDQIWALAVVGDRLISGSIDSTIRVWETQTWGCEKLLDDHVGPVYALTVLEGKLVSASSDHTIRVWGPDWECCRTLECSGVWSLNVFNDRLVSGSLDNAVKVWGA